MVSIYNKLHNALGTLQFFIESEWEWTHTNMDLLKTTMSPEDQKVKTEQNFLLMGEDPGFAL